MTGERLHGGPDDQGAVPHDFSTNGNACGPCPTAQAAVRDACAQRYPDPRYTGLRLTLAAFHGVAADRIVLAASASEFIFRMTAAAWQQGARSVWLPPHGYGDYAQAAGAHRLARVADARQAQLLWGCEPSSPLGTAQAELAAMAAALAADRFLVLDRAYEPLRLRGSGSLRPAQLDRVWQLWTPNKALGLTGVRAAYAIAPAGAAGTVAALEQLCPSWPVGAHGVALLQAWAAPEVQAWLAGSLSRLRDWKARQIGICESLGWHCLPSEANFFCARPHWGPAWGVDRAKAALRERGIQLRDTASFGLPGHVRVGVLAPAAQDALTRAWRELGLGR